MPEIEKYLNRDGLEEYNSLLPHSSGEMQEYVTDWLDAHPEATTTVQDGAITEPKLADKSVSLRTLADDTVHMLNGMMITREISGDILTADDAYSAPPVALTVEGKSTQDGTPTPDAPVEILSVDDLGLTVAGKNLFDFTQYTWSSSTYIKGTGASGSSTANDAILTFIPCAFIAGQTVAVSPHIATSGNNVLHFYKAASQASGNYLGSIQSTGIVPENATYMRVVLRKELDKGALQVELGTVSTTPYAPYIGTTVPDLLPDGTVLRSLPDGTKDTMALSYLRPSTREGRAWYSREVVQKLTALDMSDLSITKSGSFYRVTQANMKLATGNGQWILMCECLLYNNAVTKGWFEANEVNNTIRPIYGQSFKAYIRADAYATVTDLKAALAGNEVVYKLATPITTTLDTIELPVLPAPDVTAWADPSTGLQMEYVRDSNLVIQRIEEAIADQ